MFHRRSIPTVFAALIVPVMLLAQDARQANPQPPSPVRSTVATPAPSTQAPDAQSAVQPQAQGEAQQQPAPAQVATTSNSTPPGFNDRYPRYRMGAGDTFDVVFTFSTEFNQTVTIQPDGFVSMREIGDVHIQGQTTTEATQTLSKAYGKILRDPVITIVPKDFEKPYFVFSGEVRHPGKYDLRGKTTVTESVALAGGFTEAAKHSEVYLFRRVSEDAVEVKKLNVKQMLSKANLQEDIILQPGDMLFVPTSAFSKVKGLIVPRVGIGPSIH